MGNFFRISAGLTTYKNCYIIFLNIYSGVMILYITVSMKQLGKKRNKIDGEKFFLAEKPETVEELIRGSVRTCVEAYNGRFLKGENAEPLSSEEIENMSEIGKIAFGINYGEKMAEEASAAENALQAYEDGLFRIFIGENEAGELSSGINISEGENVTFIKLTMLTGRLW